jgi:hypothetical protein
MKKSIVGIAVASVSLAGMAGTSWASHGHYVVREDRNGETHCRYIAEGQTSKQEGDGGHHRFHDNVHSGQPGSDDRGTDFDRDTNEKTRCDNVSHNGQH